MAGCCGVLYLAYLEDSYGYVTLEAFHSGKPVITLSDCGGPLEVIEHGVNGLVAEPEPRALAEAMNRLWADRPAGKRMGDVRQQDAQPAPHPLGQRGRESYVMKIAVVSNQAPFVYGGAEYLADTLAARLRGRGHRVDIVRLPFKWYPPQAILEHMLAVRLLNVAAGGPDLVIALKFPAYLATFR